MSQKNPNWAQTVYTMYVTFLLDVDDNMDVVDVDDK